jgi:hypothetical protein
VWFALIPLAFPLVVDTYVLQPPIATSGETASASQVFPKGLVVRACWCAIRVEPWVCPLLHYTILASSCLTRIVTKPKNFSLNPTIGT